MKHIAALFLWNGEYDARQNPVPFCLAVAVLAAIIVSICH
ncbi:hypothetical protein ACPOL_5277 [Acidisarcina polymorpha]|uniref:Mobile element protein n=1 Tax=Acidisarcina polymorpha TaxID=2211140 RepID=A0A2Z5G6C0_9BACT|nr:hypothetical protein ACPOL_5277 [Acidisarcina polymorpha]